MILSALNNYYDRLCEKKAVPTFGYTQEKISYAIVLSRKGEIVAVNDIRDTTGKKPVPRLMSVPSSFKRPGQQQKPFFLWDKTSYVLGVTAKTDDNALKRLSQEPRKFKTETLQIIGDNDDEGLTALRQFLEHWQPEQFALPFFIKEMLDSNVVFRLDGEHEYLHERPAAQQLRSLMLSGTDAMRGTCLITGEHTSIARLHPAIKGVNGAQSSGASIISFNLEAFTSYGKEQGGNAPVSERTAAAYTTVLNHLLRRAEDNRQRLQIGDASVVFWAVAKNTKTAEYAEQVFGGILDSSKTDEQESATLRRALEAVAAGRPLKELNPDFDESTRIFVLGLAPNQGRLSIRFWQMGTLDIFVRRLADHYHDLEIQPSPWKTNPSIWRLLYATAPSREGKAKAEDIPPQLAGELTRSILTGRQYPYSLLANIIMRMRTDGDISGIRVALCKAVLMRAKRLGFKGIKEEVPMALNSDVKTPAYRLGRLFAELENAQRAALANKDDKRKSINATIRDRYYGAASATPAMIFPVLIRNSMNHLSKLRKGEDREKAIAGAIEREIQSLLDPDMFSNTFPKTLCIEDQGQFAIGYYQQSKLRFTKNANEDLDEESEQGETL